MSMMTRHLCKKLQNAHSMLLEARTFRLQLWQWAVVGKCLAEKTRHYRIHRILGQFLTKRAWLHSGQRNTEAKANDCGRASVASYTYICSVCCSCQSERVRMLCSPRHRIGWPGRFESPPPWPGQSSPSDRPHLAFRASESKKNCP